MLPLADSETDSEMALGMAWGMVVSDPVVLKQVASEQVASELVVLELVGSGLESVLESEALEAVQTAWGLTTMALQELEVEEQVHLGEQAGWGD